MNTIFKAIAVAALIASVSLAGPQSADAGMGWQTNILSDVFKGD